MCLTSCRDSEREGKKDCEFTQGYFITYQDRHSIEKRLCVFTQGYFIRIDIQFSNQISIGSIAQILLIEMRQMTTCEHLQYNNIV